MDLSIIICTSNRADYLPATLASLARVRTPPTTELASSIRSARSGESHKSVWRWLKLGLCGSRRAQFRAHSERALSSSLSRFSRRRSRSSPTRPHGEF